MSERKVNKNQIYQLSPTLIGKTVERVPRGLRKGVPDEYTKLLEEARTHSNTSVEKVLRTAAKTYVPKLCKILKNHDYPPFNIRIVVTADCETMWAKDYFEQFLPDELKHKGRQKGGNIGAQKRRTQIDNKNKEIKEKLKTTVPDIKDKEVNTIRQNPNIAKAVGLAAASQETRDRVAKSGGEAKYEQHPEDYSDMGIKSADKWAKLNEQLERLQAQTFQVKIEKEEHKEIVNAWETSLEQHGVGGYTILIKNGEYAGVEPSGGNVEKSGAA